MLHGIALRYFVEVARSGSLAAASETLHVAVSAISRQIAKLEDDVGVPLFERLPRGMVLTESGELLAGHARRALLDADAVLAEISLGEVRGGGLVRIGCTEGFTRSFLPNVLAQHYADAPHTRFVMRSGTPAQVEQWVTLGEVDIGIAFSFGNAKGATRVSIEYSDQVPVCALFAPDHPLAAREKVSLADLQGYPLALLERGTTARQLFDLCCSQHGLKIEPLLSSNNSSALHAFAALTGAITLGSRLALTGLASDLTLVARPVDEPILDQRQLWIMTMQERRLPAVVRAVVRRLVEAVKDGGA